MLMRFYWGLGVGHVYAHPKTQTSKSTGAALPELSQSTGPVEESSESESASESEELEGGGSFQVEDDEEIGSDTSPAAFCEPELNDNQEASKSDVGDSESDQDVGDESDSGKDDSEDLELLETYGLEDKTDFDY
jgi:hypothetical protein